MMYHSEPRLVLTSRSNSRYVNVGLFNLRQVFFAKYDIKVHTDKGMHQSYYAHYCVFNRFR